MPTSTRRFPRANIDPIHSAELALQVFRAQMSDPLAYETLVMFLDTRLRGSTLVTVAHTAEPNDVIDVAQSIATAVSGIVDVSGIVLASVRPDGALRTGDDDRWLEAADLVEDQGVLLVDWFILGKDTTHCPRELLGMPSRWRCGT